MDQHQPVTEPQSQTGPGPQEPGYWPGPQTRACRSEPPAEPASMARILGTTLTAAGIGLMTLVATATAMETVAIIVVSETDPIQMRGAFGDGETKPAVIRMAWCAAGTALGILGKVISTKGTTPDRPPACQQQPAGERTT